MLLFLAFALVFLLWLFDLLAVEGDAHGFLFRVDLYPVCRRRWILVGGSAEEVERVSVSLKLNFAFRQLYLVDLDLA